MPGLTIRKELSCGPSIARSVLSFAVVALVSFSPHHYFLERLGCLVGAFTRLFVTAFQSQTDILF
jgi:hypothetical protein